MSDLWTTASTDAEAESLDRHVTTARVASAALWPFLAGASSPADYANRKALSADRIERVAAAAADGDPALFGVMHAAILDGFDADFAVLHGERVAAQQIEAAKSETRKQAEADLKAQAEVETLQQILAAGLDNLGDAKAPKFGEDGEPATEDEDTTKEAGRSAECKSCGHVFASRGLGASNCPKCKSSDLRSASRKTAGDSVEVGTIPTCDVCRSAPAAYDSRLPALGGSWGNVCEACFAAYGPGQVGTGNAQRLVQRAARKTAVSLTNVGIEGDNGVGTDPSGNRVTFRLTDKERADLSAILHSDLAVNFSGVDVEESDIIKGASRKTAGDFPFGGEKKAPTDKDAGAPDQTKPDASNTDTWKCPACGSANAYTQGGVDLKDALAQKQPIQCGDCKQVDQSGGQANPADPAAPQQPGAQPPPPHHARLATYVLHPNTGSAATYVVQHTAGNPYEQSNPYDVGSPGVPDDLLDGPAAPPETTRPRVLPTGGGAPDLGTAAPATPVSTPPAPKADPKAAGKQHFMSLAALQQKG